MRTITIGGIETLVATKLEEGILSVRYCTEEPTTPCDLPWFNELKVSTALSAVLYHVRHTSLRELLRVESLHSDTRKTSTNSAVRETERESKNT